MIIRQMYLLNNYKKNVSRPLMFRYKYFRSKKVKGENMARLPEGIPSAAS